MKFKPYFSTAVLAGLLVFVTAFTTAAVRFGPPPRPASERLRLVEEVFDVWRYIAYREGGQVTLQIILDDTSPAGLQAFRAANLDMARELATRPGPLAASIVLNQPLSLTDLTRLGDEYGLHVNGFQLRVIDGRGDRVTLFGGPEDGQLVSDQLLQSMLDWIQEQTGEAKFLGVTTIDGGIPPSSYDVLSADPAVFLVDVTPGFAEHHMRQRHASLLRADDLVATAAYPVYWYLESNGQSQP
jgi:hypothetical protein